MSWVRETLAYAQREWELDRMDEWNHAMLTGEHCRKLVSGPANPPQPWLPLYCDTCLQIVPHVHDVPRGTYTCAQCGGIVMTRIVGEEG